MAQILPKKDEKGRNIQVVVRCRPFNTAERKAASHTVVECDQNRKEVTVRTGGIADKATRKVYTFDKVFGPAAKQIDVYRSVVCPILDEVIMGYNCTIFAYGQTGTGKTFTMEGDRSPDETFTWEDDPLAGIIPRTLHQIFEMLSESNTEFSVKVSLLEIYNEELFDLLSPAPEVTERLQLFDDPRNKEITVHNKDEVYQILERGAAKRKTASTLMNAYSRSENIGRSWCCDKRTEAGTLTALFSLWVEIIKALVERGPHVPLQRVQTHTHLWTSSEDALKTSIITPRFQHQSIWRYSCETLSTLDYANRAKNIMNKPEVNQKLTKRTLIKASSFPLFSCEYTEEIERLKRDLAATRDKHGVYISVDNYENMNNKLESQEEQILEYTEQIDAMEEELQKITELFSDSQKELALFTEELQDKKQRLEAAHKDLTDTKHRLTREEYIAENVQSNETVLYSTADQLLSTAEASTQDVSGLHAKLDRKKDVELHNGLVQQTFSQQMENYYNTMQNSLKEQSDKHSAMINYYRSSVGMLLNSNGKVVKETMGAVCESYSNIKGAVGESVEQCKKQMLTQEKLSEEARDCILKKLDELKQHLEESLVAQAVPGIRSIMILNDSLKQTLDGYHTLAVQMQDLKADIESSLSSFCDSFASMRTCAEQGFVSLHTEREKLKEQISLAGNRNRGRVAELIPLLQNVISNMDNDIENLVETASSEMVPLDSLQRSIQSFILMAENETESVCAKLGSTVDGVISEMNGITEEGKRLVEECAGYGGHLQTSLDSLTVSGLQWCHEARGSIKSKAQEQFMLIRETDAALQDLQKGVEEKGEKAIRDCEAQLLFNQKEIEQILNLVELQTNKNEADFKVDQETLLSVNTQTLDTVQKFLDSELRQDIPTGMTPQRKEYVYPRVLSKPKTREELEEEFKAQHEAFQSALNLCTEEEEEKPLDQDSLEDEGSVSSEGNSTEQPCSDENLICCENGRVPFFKQTRDKKSKKENVKLLNRSKVEDERMAPSYSKHPLRCQN
ncbi:hypothetical protein DNTS_014433 [Danionella cerebrum]|uniref:Kinesin motor domain-containing protein n=1 Tax=Danionella cerebrum TaxID=2873325 RepID=A0A553R9C0_9TELE|nr:hypothetical protein DNTS_014433 [Danionella translucida]TRY98777.1 hypothetical protein DNTS_014433 [Danionella translucida]